MSDHNNFVVKFPVLNSQSRTAKFIGHYVTFLVIGTSVFYPLDVAFLISYSNQWLDKLHSIVYLSMGMNILLQFFTSFIDETGIEHENVQEISAHYLKTKFVWDAIASFPYYLLLVPENTRIISENVSGSEEEVAHFIAAAFRLPLLLMILRLSQHVGSIRKSALLKGFLIVTVFIYSCHVAGCIFVASGLRSVKGNEQLSWLSIAGFVKFETSDTITYKESTFGLYVNALYWAFTTLSTTGFGDICPVDNFSRIVTIVVITYSLYMNAAIAGHVYTTLIESENRDDRILKVSKELDRWLDKSGRDESQNHDAKDDILKYFSQLWKSDLIFDVDGSFSSFLPETRMSIASQIYLAIIQKVPFLYEIEDFSFKEHFCSYLMYDFAMPGDIICGLGINDDNFIIIVSGTGAILGNSLGNVKMRLNANDTLNDHVLLGSPEPDHSIMVIAEMRTEYLFLKRNSAQEISKLFPRVVENIRQRLENRQVNNASQVNEEFSIFKDLTVIASEIQSLEKMRHVPSSDLHLIRRASDKMPSFCRKIALQTVEIAKEPSIVFESSMRLALQAMKEAFVDTSTNDNFTKLPEPTQSFTDPSKYVFRSQEDSIDTGAVPDSGNRYGAASKRWKMVVRNFMNASLFSGTERYITVTYAQHVADIETGILG
jgi:hypothetical protein